jgi:hypothetical protein
MVVLVLPIGARKSLSTLQLELYQNIDFCLLVLENLFTTLIRAALEYGFVTVNSSDNTVSYLFLTFS